MAFLVRKIEKAKWMQNDILNEKNVSADAITNCMKTKGNTLSTWRIENEGEIEQVVLAIVASHQHLDTIDIVLFNEEDLSTNGINKELCNGNTPMTSFIQRHFNLVNLDYFSLGTVSKLTVNAFLNNKVLRFRKSKLIEIIVNGINSKEIDAQSLSPSLRDKLPANFSFSG